jgi:hypothetical protein
MLKYLVLPTPDDNAAFLQIATNPTPHRGGGALVTAQSR